MFAVESAPDFGDNKKLFPGYQTFGNCPTDTFSALLMSVQLPLVREEVLSRCRNLERNQKDDSPL